MFKITMRAGGISLNVGPMAAEDIEKEFREHRPWHERVTCSYSDGALTLVAFNDWDHDGAALSDEFSDCLCAYIALDEKGDEGEFEIVSVETFPGIHGAPVQPPNGGQKMQDDPINAPSVKAHGLA